MNKDDCIFCKIANGEIPSATVYEDSICRVILDVNPANKGHALIIPKEHISSVNEITGENSAVISKVFEEAPKIAAQFGMDKDGYRIVTNCGEKAGQTVHHIHFHLLAGRDLTWPPG